MEKDIGKLKKNENTEIVIRLDDFGGKKGLTIREFVTSDRYTGFTKSGVRIPVTDFNQFKEFINSISEEDLKEEVEEEAEISKEQTTLKETEEEKSEESVSEELPDY